jgi:hypothetical protein
MVPFFFAQIPVMSRMSSVNPLERLILLSADEEGRIPYFRWQAMGEDGDLKALASMERMGYLRREPGTKFCRAFHLTELGMSLRANLRARLQKMCRPMQTANP